MLSFRFIVDLVESDYYVVVDIVNLDYVEYNNDQISSDILRTSHY